MEPYLFTVSVCLLVTALQLKKERQAFDEARRFWRGILGRQMKHMQTRIGDIENFVGSGSKQENRES